MTPPPKPVCLLYRALQRTLTLDVTWLMTLDRDALPAETFEQPGLTLRMLSRDDVAFYARSEAYDLPASMASRVGSGRDFCAGAFVDGQLASYAWFALSSIEPEQNRGATVASGVGFSFDRSTAFMYKGFTHPRFRGRGLYRAVQQFALTELAELGVARIISTADWSNAAALASCARLGFRPLGRVWVIGIGKVVWRKPPARAARFGIRGGSAAQVTRRR